MPKLVEVFLAEMVCRLLDQFEEVREVAQTVAEPLGGRRHRPTRRRADPDYLDSRSYRRNVSG